MRERCKWLKIELSGKHRVLLTCALIAVVWATPGEATCNKTCQTIGHILVARHSGFAEFRGAVSNEMTVEEGQAWDASVTLLTMDCEIDYYRHYDENLAPDTNEPGPPMAIYSCEIAPNKGVVEYTDDEARQESSRVKATLAKLIEAVRQAEPTWKWRRSYERISKSLSDVPPPTSPDIHYCIGPTTKTCVIHITLDKTLADDGVLGLDFSVEARQGVRLSVQHHG